MLGAIIGDICGCSYEHHNERDVDKIVLFRDKSYPTDDSVMTVAVAKALMDSKGLPDEEVRQQIINSMHYYGHLFPHAGYGGTFKKWLEMYRDEPYNSWGNGSAMRVSSVSFLFDTLEDVLKYARISAEVTHDHPEGIRGAQAIAAAGFLARTGKTKEEIRAYIEKYFYKLDFMLDEIRPTYQFDVSCQGSCPQAIEAFLEGNDFGDVIKKAISIGGDSDTIAAMAGGIAEAFYGIPEEFEQKAFEFLKDQDNGFIHYKNSALAAEVRRLREFIKK